jgi:hypothetical protein
MDEKPVICTTGFHFCIKASHCFSYYDFNPLYRMVSREETLITETHPDLKYPDHF